MMTNRDGTSAGGKNGFLGVYYYGKRDIGICNICGKNKPIWSNENGIICKGCVRCV